eukprot:219197_1
MGTLLSIANKSNQDDELSQLHKNHENILQKFPSNFDILCDGGSINNCTHLQRLVQLVAKTNCSNIYDENAYHLIMLLNDYHHILAQHDTDEEFEFIVNAFGDCNIFKCQRFRRNYRDRYETKENNINNKQNNISSLNIYDEIIDKIHCYFLHTYNMCYRLSNKDKKTLHINDNSSEKSELFVNAEMLRLSQLLSKRRYKIQHECNISSSRFDRKYNQLTQDYEDSKAENTGTYSYGFKFEYGYFNEYEADDTNNVIVVSAKYSSVKQELINNDIATINIEQFNNEYKKAKLHLCSYYCRKHFGSFIDTKMVSYYYDKKDNNPKFEWIFLCEYILALMIYCNYDYLQYEFSKTYRENKENNKHNNFFYFGKYLKIA